MYYELILFHPNNYFSLLLNLRVNMMLSSYKATYNGYDIPCPMYQHYVF